VVDIDRVSGAMRVIVTARQTLTPGYTNTLQRLVAILGVISRNPSNPNFDQYIFESISALMRCGPFPPVRVSED
jgi:exportin-2 (importin alpha re-exporter)